MSRTFLLLALALAACSHPSGPPPDAGAADAGVDAGVVCMHVAAPAPLRRLTRAEYDATVHDLLGDATHPAAAFPPDEESQGFDNFALTQTVSPLLAEQYLTAAEALAAAADPLALAGCGAATAEPACLTKLLETFGRRAFRRPLTADETARFTAVFTQVRAQDDEATSLRAVMTVMLEAPQFLYRFESDPLTGYELAARLSYFLWGSQPDDALLDAAASGPLDVEAQARRMLADPRAKAVVRRFHLQWLGVAALTDKAKDPIQFPDFPALAPLMLEETQRFTEWAVFDGNGDAQRLFNGRTTFLDGSLAQLYGFTGLTGPDFVKVDTDQTARVGVLTQGSVLSAWAKSDQTSPVLRGKLVRERFLCQTPKPPPGNVVAMIGVPTSSTTRDRFAAHVGDPSCNGCHQLMDPVGFGLEKYGPTGAFRTYENLQKIDARGEVIAGGDLDGTFDGAVELSDKLAASRDVKRCYALQWFRFAFGRAETDADACSVENAQAVFEKSGWNTRELLVALVLTDSFRRSAR
jgi:hypothetical protein